MRINIFVGDEGGDGHDKEEHITIESNLSKKDLDKAYKNGSKKLGFDFWNVVAVEYEDSDFPIDMLQKLRDSGYSNTFENEEDYHKLIAKPKNKRMTWERENPKGPSINMDEYIDVVLFICKLGNSEFEYEIINDDNDYWHIGGYGLLT